MLLMELNTTNFIAKFQDKQPSQIYLLVVLCKTLQSEKKHSNPDNYDSWFWNLENIKLI